MNEQYFENIMSKLRGVGSQMRLNIFREDSHYDIEMSSMTAGALRQELGTNIGAAAGIVQIEQNNRVLYQR